MSDSYKKYLDKAKKKSQDTEDSKRKQEKDFKDLYTQFHLKYAMGTASVPSTSANTASSLSPLLKEQYAGKDDKKKKFHDLKPNSNSESPDVYAHFNEGGQVQESQQKQYQAKEYFGKGDGDSSGPLSRMNKGGPVYPKEQFKEEDFSDKGLRTIVPGYDEGTPSVSDAQQGFLDAVKKAFNPPPPAASPGPSLDDKYKKIRADQEADRSRTAADYNQVQHYDDGTSNVQTSPNVDPQKLQAAQDSLRKAFHFDDGTDDVPMNAETKAFNDAKENYRRETALHISHPGEVKEGDITKQQQEQSPYQKYLNLFGGLPSVPKLKNPLAVVHAPTEKKYPLNIPKAARITIPKRLKSVSDIKGYDNGGTVQPIDPAKAQEAQDSLRKAFHFADGAQNVPNQTMDLGDIPITPSTPYPGEEEAAQQTVDNSTQGQIQKEIDAQQQGQSVLNQIDAALAKQPQGDQPAPQADTRNLEGMTLDKDEAKAENPDDKSLEDQYKAEEDVAEKEADKAPAADEKKDEEPKKEDKLDDNGPSKRLLDAQAAQRNSILFNQLGKISDKMGASMGHFQAQNQDIYDENIKNADLPVKQLEQQIAMEKYDPNSKTSQAFRQYLTKFGGQDVADLGSISAAQAESIAPMAFKQFEAQQAQQAKQLEIAARNQERLQQTQLQVEQRREAAQQHNDMMRLMLQNKNDAAADKKAQQDADKQNKIFAGTGQLLEQMRGSPAVSQAEKDIYAAQKADSLATLYPNPDQMNPQQVRLLATEISKIASGGAPTMEELKGVTPDTFRGRLAGVVQKFTNSPSPANAGDFIKQYQDYTKALTKDAQKVITDRYNRIIEPRKSLMSGDQYDMLKDQYINRFSDALKSPTKPQDNAGKTVVRKGYNAKTNQTQLIYSDGTKEILDGKQ